MTELELLVDLHQDGPRQGPGSSAETLLALQLTGLDTDRELQIADIGCGSGAHTLVLAQNSRAKLTAVDLFPVFLNRLEEQAQRLNLHYRITTLQASMEALPFEANIFDVIWSEGAIYSMGFEAGVQAWKPFLKNGGYLCVSEATWITNARPTPIEEFWQAEYPEIGTAAQKISTLEKHGFTLAGYFHLSPESWIEQYYRPLQERFPAFLERHRHSKAAQAVVEAHREEVALYRRYKAYYSYGFYVARKDRA